MRRNFQQFLFSLHLQQPLSQNENSFFSFLLATIDNVSVCVYLCIGVAVCYIRRDGECILFVVVCECSLEHIVYTIKAELSYPSVTQFFFCLVFAFDYLCEQVFASMRIESMYNTRSTNTYTRSCLSIRVLFVRARYRTTTATQYIQIVLHNRMLCSSNEEREDGKKKHTNRRILYISLSVCANLAKCSDIRWLKILCISQAEI